MPGDRTCSGGAYTFQIPGSLAAQDNVAIPMKVQNAASIRCVYAYLQQGTSDGQSAYVVKYSTDGGTTWNVLEKMGIAQSIGTPFKNTWDFLVSQGYGKPETRRLPYGDYGLITTAPITGIGVAQALATASYDASTSSLVPGDFVFLEFGLANEEPQRPSDQRVHDGDHNCGDQRRAVAPHLDAGNDARQKPQCQGAEQPVYQQVHKEVSGVP